MEDNPYVVIGEGDQASVVVEGDARVEIVEGVGAEQLLDITALKGKFEPTHSWKRDSFYRASVPSAGEHEAPVLIDIHVDGQSLSNGTLSEGRMRNNQPRSANALMKELVGGPDKQGPWKASHEFTGALIPLIEGLTTRSNPTVINPANGFPTQFGPGNGETICSGMVDQILDQIEASGLQLHNVRICATSTGIGGRTYKELTAGTLSDKWLRQSVLTGFRYARAQNWGYLPIKVWVHGETDSNQNPAAGDDELVVSSDMTPREYAGYLIQDRARFRDLVREITGIDYDPWMFVSQVGSTYPGGWRKPDMRLANTAEGQRLATHMDSKIVGGPANYVGALIDRLHGFMAGYNLLGRSFGDPIFRTIFGNGRYRPPEMIAARRISQTKARIIIDNSAGELRVQRYQVSEWSIASGGERYRVGDELRATTMDTAARWVVDVVNSAGAIVVAHLTDPGSHSAALEGVVATQTPITGATVASPGIGTAIDGAYATVLGGTYKKQARFTVTVLAGVVTDLLLFEAGEYSVLPVNPVGISTAGVVGLTANLNSLGSGGSFNVLSYLQLCQTNEVPFFQSVASSSASKTIQNVGSGYLRGDVAYAVGGVLSDQPGAHSASINVGLTDTNGGVTNAAMRSGGVYKVLPPQPVEYRSATGSGCTILSPVGSFPVADPGNLGFDIDDDTPVLAGIETYSGLRPPRLTAVQVVDNAEVAQTALDITVDQFWGHSTWIMAGQRPQGANGPTAGGRTVIASPPPRGSKPGPLGLFPQAFLWRGGVPLNTPVYQPNRPILDNSRFMVAQDGVPAEFLIPANAGLYPLDRWRAYRSVAGGRVLRVTGERQSYALRLQRVQGDNAVAQIQIAQVIVGDQVAETIGKTLVATVRGRFGSDASGAVTLRVYTFATVAAFGGQLPPGSATLAVRTISADRTGWDLRYVGSAGQLPTTDVLVPSGTQMIGFSVIYTPGTGVAGAADYFEFEEPSLNTGTVPRDFNPQSESEEWHRCALWYRRPVGGLYVGTTPTVYSLDPPMRAVPTVSGGGPGFSSANTTNSALVVSQTTAGVQPLVLSARL